jgi:hypothetical protein
MIRRLDPADLLRPVHDPELFQTAHSELGPLAVMIVDFLAERRWITAVVTDSLEHPSFVGDLGEFSNEALSAYGRSTHRSNLLSLEFALRRRATRHRAFCLESSRMA